MRLLTKEVKTRQRPLLEFTSVFPGRSGLSLPWPVFLLRFNPVSDTHKRPAQQRKCEKALDVDSLEDDLPFQPTYSRECY